VLGSFPTCAEHKTSAEIAALGGNFIACTLAQAMAYIWLLETCDIAFGSTTKTSLQVGNTDNFVQPYSILTPKARMCGLPGGFGVETDTASPFTIEGENGYARLLIGSVYFDTTNSNYALFLSLQFTAGSLGDVYGTFQKPGWVSNGGTCTLFGTSVASFKQSTIPDANFSVSNAAYYTPV
jgi:hypothetical protein